MAGILESSLYLSVTAVVILLFKWIFKRKLSAKWHMWIWALLALRLVLPSLPESSFSIFNAFDIPKAEIQVEKNLEETITKTPDFKSDDNPATTDVLVVMQDERVPSNTIIEDVEKNSHVIPDANDAFNTGKDENTKAVALMIAECVVYSGAIVIFLYFVLIYIICIRRNARKSRAQDSETLMLLEECKRKVGVKRRVSIVIEGETPMLMGLFKPTIVLPDGYTESEKKNILIHELCHLKSGDIYLLWLAMIVMCLNWYNPIMWICFFTFRRDVEVYCDEKVLKYVDSKKDYAALLVKTALKKNSFVAGTTSLQNGEKEVEQRVKHMAYFKKPHYMWTIVIVLMAVIIGIVCLTNPVGNEKDENDAAQIEPFGEDESESQIENEQELSETENEGSEQEFSLTYDGFTFKKDTRVEEIVSYFPTSERWEEPQNFVFVAGCIECRRISLYYPGFHAPRIRINCIQNLETSDSFIERIVVYDDEATTVTGAQKVKSYKEEYGIGTVYELCVDSPESAAIEAYQKSIFVDTLPDAEIKPVPDQAPVPVQETFPVTENEAVTGTGTLDNALSDETQLPEAAPVSKETEIPQPMEITEITPVTENTETAGITVTPEEDSDVITEKLDDEVVIESDFIW